MTHMTKYKHVKLCQIRSQDSTKGYNMKTGINLILNANSMPPTYTDQALTCHIG